LAANAGDVGLDHGLLLEAGVEDAVGELLIESDKVTEKWRQNLHVHSKHKSGLPEPGSCQLKEKLVETIAKECRLAREPWSNDGAGEAIGGYFERWNRCLSKKLVAICVTGSWYGC
jgi:hypothetical protein